MMDAFAFLGEEAGIDTLVIERLDEFPHHVAHHGDGEAPGRWSVLAVLIEVVSILGG